MSTAGEGFNVNTLLGTCLLASATACTLGVIYNGEIVLNLDCAVRTGLLTLHTADTTNRADLVGNSTLIVAGALNYNARALAYDMNNAVGTGLSAKATADTLSGIDISDTGLGIDNDSVLRTNSNTVTVAKTSEGTSTVTCIIKLCSLTGLYTVVNVLSLFGLASTVTSNVSNLSINVTCCKAYDLSDLSSNFCTAGDTEAGVVGLALTESLSIAVASGITARTAVCTGKAVTNCNNLLIFLNCEEGSSKGKNYRTNDSDNTNNN